MGTAIGAMSIRLFSILTMSRDSTGLQYFVCSKE
jgi:hypothetical protein